VAIFAAAPPDHRRLIDQLKAVQLTLDDLPKTLDPALAAQDERRHWILKDWPHIVEHAEITRTLTTHTAGPDLGPLLDQLAVLDLAGAADDHPQLVAAARAAQPWLRAALSELLPPDVDHVSPPVVELLDVIANYRGRWQITHPSPLGLAATTDEQAQNRADLIHRIADSLPTYEDQSVLADQRATPTQDPPVADLSL
jgi:hypothetical protein